MPAAARQRKSETRSQNVTGKKARAAVLLAEDELTDEQIADEVGVTRRQLARWKHDPEFNALIGDHVGQLQATALKFSIAKKHKRMEALDRLHRKALDVIDLRAQRFTVQADSPEEAVRKMFGSNTPPEAATGLLVRKETITASGMTSTEWTFDASLVKEIRELQKQAATELGQWVEKSEQDQRVGITRRYILEDDE